MSKFTILINDYAMYGRDTKHMSQDQLYELCYEYMLCIKKYDDNDTLDVSLPFHFLSVIAEKEDDRETEFEMYARLRSIKSEIQRAVIDEYHSDVSEILDEKIECFKHTLEYSDVDSKIDEALLFGNREINHVKNASAGIR